MDHTETLENLHKGQRVSYEDMANPRRFGTLTGIKISTWGTQYEVTWDDGTTDTSDLRQCGWRSEESGVEMDHQTTLEQIGRETLGSVGARRFTKTDDSLSFVLSRGHRMVTVTLNGDDTYTVTARMIRSGKETYSAEHIYCDALSEAIWQSHLER